MILLKKIGDNIMISSGDCIISCDLKKEVDTLLKIPEPIVPENLTKGQIDVLKKEIRNITCFDVHNKTGYIAVSTENKQVVVYNRDYSVIKNFIVNRAASKVCFTPNADILVADKTGDVYLYKITSDKEHPQLLLGHLSVILDMTLSECGKYVITCDRDEKIRVSCFPNSYNIISFCLGHTEFVTCIKLVKNFLVSTSGDGTVRFWNYLQGKQLGIINTKDHIANSSLLDAFAKQMDNEKVDVTALPVTDMQVCYKDDKFYTAVSFYKFSAVQLYSTDLSTFTSNYIVKLDLSSDCFSFYVSDNIYVVSDKFTVFKFENETFVEMPFPYLEKLYDKYKDILKQSEDDSVTVLYKRKFDNVQEYLERKRQRLEGK